MFTTDITLHLILFFVCGFGVFSMLCVFVCARRNRCNSPRICVAFARLSASIRTRPRLIRRHRQPPLPLRLLLNSLCHHRRYHRLCLLNHPPPPLPPPLLPSSCHRHPPRPPPRPLLYWTRPLLSVPRCCSNTRRASDSSSIK